MQTRIHVYSVSRPIDYVSAGRLESNTHSIHMKLQRFGFAGNVNILVNSALTVKGY